MLELQNEMLEHSKRAEAVNKARTHQLYEMQAHLRKRFIDINSFMKECSDKQQSAEKVVADESALQAETQQNIEKYEKNIHELNEFRKTLKSTLDEMEPYETVIEDVVDKSPIFDSTKDCIDRCDALMLAQVEIKSLEEQKMQEIEEMRQRMIKVTNEAALTVLGMKNDITELERAYDDQRNACCRWERIYEDAREAVTANELQKDRIYDSVNHMYRLLCQRRGGATTLFRSDFEESLEYIKEEVSIIREVIKQCNAEIRKEKENGNENDHTSDKENVYC